MEKIGTYTILDVLHRGAQPLYRAKGKDGKEVAVKAIPVAGLSAEMRERFTREAKTAQKLDHPNLVRVFEAGEADGHLYHAMELLVGSDLGHIMAEGRKFTWEDKLSIMEQVCDGLQYAHEHHLVHRDIKPANLFLENSGKVRVLDFGMVRVAESELTKVGSSLGTLNYMSPEQIRGDRCTAASDVFSVGIVFYQLATGRHPFSSKDRSLAKVVSAIVFETPPKISEICPDAPEGLEFILNKAMEKDRANRIQNVGDLKQALSLCRITMKLGISQAQPGKLPETRQYGGSTLPDIGGKSPGQSGSGAAPAQEDAEKTQVIRREKAASGLKNVRQPPAKVESPPPDDAPPAAPTAPLGNPASQPGEFTQLFQTGAARAKPQGIPQQPVEAPASLIPPATTAAPVASFPGEFSRMFQDSPKAPTPETLPTLTPPPASGPESGPGEFTRMFQAGGRTDHEPPKPGPAIPAFRYCSICTTPNPPAAPVCRGCGNPLVQIPQPEIPQPMIPREPLARPPILGRLLNIFSRKSRVIPPPSESVLTVRRPRETTPQPEPGSDRVERSLDLAISERVPVYVPVELIALIRLPQSVGLGVLLDADRDSVLSAKDVRSHPMRIDLPKDARGATRPADLVMRITAPDFEPPSQEKTIRVYPDVDCERQTFLLTPQHTGDLRIQFDLLQSDRALASRLLRATADASDRSPSTQRLVVTVPLDLQVDPNLAKLPLRPQRDFWQQFEGRSIENTYRLTRILGVGGFGGVFLADHLVEKQFIRHVAVKLILSDADQLQRQLGELVASTTLRHPHLLEAFHAGSIPFEGSRLLYLVMELADEQLQSRLDQGLLSKPEARGLIEEIVPAIACLHERKFVHRDIKPANVLRASGSWKLSDFGTLRQSAGPATNQTELITGTIHYMSPESFEGIVSPAWDMWSFGILLLRALSGRAAFEGTNDQQLMWSILQKDPAIPSDLTTPFSEIVRGCLTKDYRQRWTSQQVLDALRR